MEHTTRDQTVGRSLPLPLIGTLDKTSVVRTLDTYLLVRDSGVARGARPRLLLSVRASLLAFFLVSGASYGYAGSKGHLGEGN